jgi:hypothetical protein
MVLARREVNGLVLMGPRYSANLELPGTHSERARSLESDMDYSDKRKHSRVNVDFYADWGRSLECEHFDKITSLSAGGCFLATQKELRSKDVIYLRISAERFGALKVQGEVKYQFRIMEGLPPTGVGVEFVGVSSQDERTLEEFVNHCRLSGS